MPRVACCVATCKGKSKDASVTYIPFPQDPKVIVEWKTACRLPGEFQMKPYTRICSRHFRTGKRSLNPDSEDYIPSVFEFEEQTTSAKRSYCRTCRKMTVTCPCKVAAAKEAAEEEDEEEDSEIEEDPLGDAGADHIEDDEEEVQEPPDDGEVLDSDDDDWTPAVIKEEVKPRRSNRSRKRRRDSSESSTGEGSGGIAEETPPAKMVKQASPVKKSAVSATKGKGGRNGKTEAETEEPELDHANNNNEAEPEAVLIKTAKPRGRASKGKVTTNGPPTFTPTAAALDHEAVGATPTIPTKTPVGGRKIITTPLLSEKVSDKVKEIEDEYAMKLEKIQKAHNMRYANLKEEHVQTIHRMKIEWELEKANLLSQIEYYKEATNHKTDEEPMNPFNGGQPIIILPPTDLNDALEAEPTTEVKFE